MTVTVDDLIPARGQQGLHRKKIQVILPEELHARIQMAAKTRRMSMNAMLTQLLEKIFPAEAAADAGTKATQ